MVDDDSDDTHPWPSAHAEPTRPGGPRHPSEASSVAPGPPAGTPVGPWAEPPPAPAPAWVPPHTPHPGWGRTPQRRFGAGSLLVALVVLLVLLIGGAVGLAVGQSRRGPTGPTEAAAGPPTGPAVARVSDAAPTSRARARAHRRPVTPVVSPSPSTSATTSAPQPSTSVPVTPRKTAPAAPVASRVCWDGAVVGGGEACSVPVGMTGLRAAFPTFARAYDAGSCSADPNAHTAGGYVCDVPLPQGGTAPVHFAWYADPASELAWFRNHYPQCTPSASVVVTICGPGSDPTLDRDGLRYVDTRFLFEATDAVADGGTQVLAAVHSTSPTQLLAGVAR